MAFDFARPAWVEDLITVVEAGVTTGLGCALIVFGLRESWCILRYGRHSPALDALLAAGLSAWRDLTEGVS